MEEVACDALDNACAQSIRIVELRFLAYAGVQPFGLDETPALPSEREFGNELAISLARCLRCPLLAQRVQAGLAGIDVLIAAPSAFHGFGGLKSSIFGSVAIRRPEGVGYAAPVTESWREGARPGASFGVSLLK